MVMSRGIDSIIRPADRWQRHFASEKGPMKKSRVRRAPRPARKGRVAKQSRAGDSEGESSRN